MNMDEKIKAAIESMNESEAVSLWNEYCDADSRYDDRIYSMEEFDEIMNGMAPWEIARTCYYSGNFCPAHDYFWFNGYANTESSDFPSMDSKSPFYIDELTNYIVENENALYNDDIQEILDDCDESEEE